MRRLIASLLLVVATVTAAAQSPREVLDKTAQTLERAGSARAEFSVAHYAGKQRQAESRGSIDIKGDKLHLTTPEMGVWYDGTTQWSLMASSNEVNIQEPTDEELAMINPYAFISLYKQGYTYKMKRAQYEGADTYEVTLTAKSKGAELSAIVLNIDPATMTPRRIRVKYDGDWISIAVTRLAMGVALDDAGFVFPAAEYPGVQVIDLR